MATTSPAPPTTTTPLRVPGVIQPTVTDSTTSSVTANPDVSATATWTTTGDSVTLAISGHGGVGFTIGNGLNAVLVTPQLSFDSGTTWVTTNFVVPLGSTLSTGTTLAGTGFSKGITLMGGATHVRVIISGAVSGSATATLKTTVATTNTIASSLSDTEIVGNERGYAVRPLPAGGNVVIFGGFNFGLPVGSPLRLGGTPFTLRAAGTAGGFAPPVVTATQPPQTVMTFSGKIPGATINNYVLDAVTVKVLGPAAVASDLFARVVKRHVLYASTQTVAPAAGAVPTGAALAYTSAANGGGTFQYKYVAVDIWGNEGNISAASANVAPAANNGVTVTCPAVPAGAAGYNVYRTVTGPGATWFFLGRTNTATFRDITPDSSLTLVAGTIGVWGTLPTIETVNAPMELVMEKFVALTGTAPVIISTKTFPGTNFNNRVVTIAPGTGVGRYRIPGEVEAKAFLAAPTITTALARDIDINYLYGGSNQINAAFGDIAVNSFNQSDAGMGGTFCVWGHELVGVTEATVPTTYNGVAVADAGVTEGSTLMMKWVAPPVFAAADEIAVEIGASVTSVATSLEVMVAGRYF